MTQNRTRWRRIHRAHTAVTIIVALTLVVLHLTGVLSGGTAVPLFLAVELPLILVFITVTVLRFKHRTDQAGPTGLLDRLEAEEPLLRFAVCELRAYRDLIRALRRRHDVPGGATPFGYTKGMMTIPAVMTAVSLVEVAIVHILIPWTWLQMVLLLLSAWGVLFMLGYFATRVVNPHYVTDGSLHLRWGHQAVLSTPLSNVAVVTSRTDHSHNSPRIDDDRLILAGIQGTNVLIQFTEPVSANAPVSARHRREDFRTARVHLYVDDPDEFLRTLRPLLDTVSP